MSCDRILVMKNGQVVEYDTPDALLKKDGEFSQMMKSI
jgi:ABC-type multidrug transport system fused ATPase/permease subunit